jgi:hypothetical protein
MVRTACQLAAFFGEPCDFCWLKRTPPRPSIVWPPSGLLCVCPMISAIMLTDDGLVHRQSTTVL